RGRCGGGCGFARRHRGGGISPRRSPGPRSLAAGRVLRIRAAGGSASLPARVGTVLPDGTLSAGSPVARSTTTTRTTRAAGAVAAGRLDGTGVTRTGTARTVPSRSSAGGAWTCGATSAGACTTGTSATGTSAAGAGILPDDGIDHDVDVHDASDGVGEVLRRRAAAESAHEALGAESEHEGAAVQPVDVRVLRDQGPAGAADLLQLVEDRGPVPAHCVGIEPAARRGSTLRRRRSVLRCARRALRRGARTLRRGLAALRSGRSTLRSRRGTLWSRRCRSALAAGLSLPGRRLTALIARGLASTSERAPGGSCLLTPRRGRGLCSLSTWALGPRGLSGLIVALGRRTPGGTRGGCRLRRLALRTPALCGGRGVLRRGRRRAGGGGGAPAAACLTGRLGALLGDPSGLLAPSPAA